MAISPKDDIATVAASVHWDGLFNLVHEKADGGDAVAQFLLGYMFTWGKDVSQNHTEAVKWFRRAAERGHDGAQYLLAEAYQLGRGVSADREEAARWCLKAAEKGLADAQYLLGLSYLNGEDDQHNVAKALTWLRKAAEQGWPKAQCVLGIVYASNRWVPQDQSESSQWFRKAAEQGEVLAQFYLGIAYKQGIGVPQDNVKAVEWFLKAAENGDPHAQFNLGLAYFSGDGIQRDHKEAVKWFREAAERGLPDAQFFLGWVYEYGYGIPPDEPETDVESVKWYRKAAEQGECRAQYRLAVAYELGHGVPRNYVEAASWYLKSAEQGYSKAQFELGRAYDLGQGIPQDHAKAMNWYIKAAEQGNVKSMYELGNIFFTGNTVLKDYTKAYFWWSLAASISNGEDHGKSKKMLDDLHKVIAQEQINEVNRRIKDWKGRQNDDHAEESLNDKEEHKSSVETNQQQQEKEPDSVPAVSCVIPPSEYSNEKEEDGSDIESNQRQQEKEPDSVPAVSCVIPPSEYSNEKEEDGSCIESNQRQQEKEPDAVPAANPVPPNSAPEYLNSKSEATSHSPKNKGRLIAYAAISALSILLFAVALVLIDNRELKNGNVEDTIPVNKMDSSSAYSIINGDIEIEASPIYVNYTFSGFKLFVKYKGDNYELYSTPVLNENIDEGIVNLRKATSLQDNYVFVPEYCGGGNAWRCNTMKIFKKTDNRLICIGDVAFFVDAKNSISKYYENGLFFDVFNGLELTELTGHLDAPYITTVLRDINNELSLDKELTWGKNNMKFIENYTYLYNKTTSQDNEANADIITPLLFNIALSKLCDKTEQYNYYNDYANKTLTKDVYSFLVSTIDNTNFNRNLTLDETGKLYSSQVKKIYERIEKEQGR